MELPRYASFKLLCSSILLLLSVHFPAVPGQMYAPCPSGWLSYDKEMPHTCVWVSATEEDSVESAQTSCGAKNSSLLMIPSKTKYEFFKDLAKVNNKVWIGLIRQGRKLFWLTKNGTIPATAVADTLSEFYENSYLSYRSVAKGLLYKQDQISLPSLSQSYRNSARYICEKPTVCKKGWLSSDCDKECHCHGQECHPTDLDIVCQYGCELGWMGKSCNHRKEDADVTFFCVNSPDEGKYVQLVINTKGVNYENIHSVTDEGKWVPWCNNTKIETDLTHSLESIIIYVNQTQSPVKDNECAGKITDQGHYQWRIKIQEKEGLVSRNDQEVQVECDFSKADTFSMSAKGTIQRERWFKRSDIKRPLQYLDEVKEKVDLQLVDPSTGEQVTRAQIGSSVALKIRFGLTEGNKATGVLPYNCDASTPDSHKKVQLLDSNGCPVVGSPISAFSESGEAKHLITEPFPLFGFEGNAQVVFHCSYHLCFGSQDCLAGCHSSSNSSSRHRRSTEQRVTGSVELMMSNEIENSMSGTKREVRQVPESGSAKPSIIPVCMVTVTMATIAILW